MTVIDQVEAMEQVVGKTGSERGEWTAFPIWRTDHLLCILWH